jgi:uncharacterized damage-inducible protein DinB
MPAFDFITYVEYNNWANKQLLCTAENLTDEQLNRPLPGSDLSTFDTLCQMLEFEWSWRMACEEYETWILYGDMSGIDNLKALRYAWARENQRLLAFVQTLPAEGFKRAVTCTWMDKPFEIGHLLMHMVNRAAIARHQLIDYFTDCGYPAGELELLNYLSQSSRQEVRDEKRSNDV